MTGLSPMPSVLLPPSMTGSSANNGKPLLPMPTDKTQFEFYQRMINISSDNLLRLRSHPQPRTGPSELIREEIKTLEGKLVRLFYKQLRLLQSVPPNGDAPKPNVKQWLNVVGLDKSLVEALLESGISLSELVYCPDKVHQLLEDLLASGNDRNRLLCALDNIRRYEARYRQDEKARSMEKEQQPSSSDLHWELHWQSRISNSISSNGTATSVTTLNSDAYNSTPPASPVIVHAKSGSMKSLSSVSNKSVVFMRNHTDTDDNNSEISNVRHPESVDSHAGITERRTHKEHPLSVSTISTPETHSKRSNSVTHHRSQNQTFLPRPKVCYICRRKVVFGVKCTDCRRHYHESCLATADSHFRQLHRSTHHHGVSRRDSWLRRIIGRSSPSEQTSEPERSISMSSIASHENECNGLNTDGVDGVDATLKRHTTSNDHVLKWLDPLLVNSKKLSKANDQGTFKRNHVRSASESVSSGGSAPVINTRLIESVSEVGSSLLRAPRLSSGRANSTSVIPASPSPLLHQDAVDTASVVRWQESIDILPETASGTSGLSDPFEDDKKPTAGEATASAIATDRYDVSPLTQEELKELDEWTIPMDEVDIGSLLSVRRLGKLHKACWHGDCVAQVLDITSPTDEQLTIFQREVLVLKQTRHEAINLFMAAVMKPPHFAIVSHFEKGRTLFERIHINEETFSIYRLKPIAESIIQGMGYLHKCGLVHRNLRSRNVFVDENGRAVITDFAMTPEHAPVLEMKSSLRSRQQTKYVIRTEFLQYQPPEVMRSLHASDPNMRRIEFGRESDVFAFGTLIYEMLVGKFPYNNMETEMIIFKVGSGYYPRLLLNETRVKQRQSPVKRTLIHAWAHDPNKRWTFREFESVFHHWPKEKVGRSPSYPTTHSEMQNI